MDRLVLPIKKVITYEKKSDHVRGRSKIFLQVESVQYTRTERIANAITGFFASIYLMKPTPSVHRVPTLRNGLSVAPQITNRSVYCVRCKKLSFFDYLTNWAYCKYCDLTFSLREQNS